MAGTLRRLGATPGPVPDPGDLDEWLTWLDSGISLKVARGVHMRVTGYEGSANSRGREHGQRAAGQG